MKKESLEQQIEDQLKRFEEAVELPFNAKIGEQMFFVRDGIIDVAEYINSPVKILWVLKEAHSTDNSLDDMRSYLKSLWNEHNNIHPKWGNTWRPIAYSTYAIFEGLDYLSIPEMKGNAKEVLKHMPKIAHVNLKKIAGESMAKEREIRDFYNKHQVLIHEQIEIINPDILIFGGTFNFFDKEYFDNAKKIKEWRPIYNWKDKLIIDTYHPGQTQITEKEYCDEIIDAVKEWRQKVQK